MNSNLNATIKKLSLVDKFSLWQYLTGIAQYPISESILEIAKMIDKYKAKYSNFPEEILPENWKL